LVLSVSRSSWDGPLPAHAAGRQPGTAVLPRGRPAMRRVSGIDVRVTDVIAARATPTTRGRRRPSSRSRAAVATPLPCTAPKFTAHSGPRTWGSASPAVTPWASKSRPPCRVGARGPARSYTTNGTRRAWVLDWTRAHVAVHCCGTAYIVAARRVVYRSLSSPWSGATYYVKRISGPVAVATKWERHPLVCATMPNLRWTTARGLADHAMRAACSPISAVDDQFAGLCPPYAGRV